MAYLHQLIKEVSIRNRNNEDLPLLGVNKDKEFMPSVANTIGTDLSTYKVVKKGQFATNLMHVDRDELVPVSLLKNYDKALISPAYNVFEIIDEKIINCDYLLICFKRKIFDKNAWFLSGSSIRGNLEWKKFLDIEIPLPNLDEQHRIVEEYNAISERIAIKEAINNNLFEQMKSIFKIHISSNIDDNINNALWKTAKLSQICNIVYGKGLPTTNLTDSGYPVYGGNGIIGFYNKYLYNERKVLISCRGVASGNVLYSIPYSFVTSNSLVLNIVDNRFTFEYLYLLALTIDFKSKVTGSAQPQLTVENIKDLDLLVVDRDTLTFITKTIRSYINQIDINVEEINNLVKIKDSLLNNLAKRQ